MRALDVVQRLALCQVAGHFQVQGQRGQLVAEQVMQLARNAVRSLTRALSASRARVARSSE